MGRFVVRGFIGRRKTPPPDAEESLFLQCPQAAFFRVPKCLLTNFPRCQDLTRQDGETLPSGRVAKPVIEGNQLQASRLLLA